MISWSDINLLQKQKKDLQIKLDELLNSNDKTPDRINELKSEILYLDKQIEKILGTNEIERQKELKRQKSGVEQRNVKSYYALKDKYKKISKMKLATTKMISLIEAYQKQDYSLEEEIVKVKK